jgi:hypothetical protein
MINPRDRIPPILKKVAGMFHGNRLREGVPAGHDGARIKYRNLSRLVCPQSADNRRSDANLQWMRQRRGPATSSATVLGQMEGRSHGHDGIFGPMAMTRERVSPLKPSILLVPNPGEERRPVARS